ncbi:hypothetical protein [Altericroceibacterium xinjiangense]|uniref:hypothetical protein n=1 Tax=Altericroceibacterium xinjiangense TaxID=762261 RepID=UPI000F7F3DB8|nr:hypothetical protein [Altericroceibacterium xinjiangense]
MIAIAGPNLPHDLLRASGRYAGPLPYDPDRDAPTAARWLESKFAPWAPPAVEAWAKGEYDGLEHVLFSRADDTSQRVYYYLCELQRQGLLGGPRPMILDVAKIDRPSSLERTIAKVRELMTALAVTPDALERSIVETNRLRSLPPPVPSSAVCLLSGTAPPDERMHAAIRAAGFAPVGRTLAEDWADLGQAVEENSGDPAAAVGRQLHARKGGPRSFADPAAALARAIEKNRAAAVVLWRIEEDEAQTWQLPAERQMLQHSGVPSLVLTRRDWRGRDGVFDEIREFLAGVTA